MKVNKWNVNTKKSELLSWGSRNKGRKLSLNELNNFLVKINNWLKSSDIFSIDRVQSYFYYTRKEGDSMNVVVSENVQTENLEELMRLISKYEKEPELARKLFEGSNNYQEKDLLNGENLNILGAGIDLNAKLSQYDRKGDIITSEVGSVLSISIGTYDLQKSEASFNVGLTNFSDIWLPETCYGARFAEDVLNEDNLELSKLNLPLLRSAIESLMDLTGLKFEVNVDLKGRNEELLEIKNNSIKFRSENEN